MMPSLARIFILVGLLFLLVGGLIYLANRLGLPLGRLPGDIRIERGNVQVYIPFTTMIVLSIILSIVLSVLARLFNRP
jgi:biotin transporter BioY